MLDQEQVTIAFTCFSKDVPRGVQVHRVSGGKAPLRVAAGEQGVLLDLNDFLARASIDDVQVINNQGYCIVYLNCTVGRNYNGLDFWGKKHGNKPYDDFIHELARCTWGYSSIKTLKGKTFISLRDYSYGPVNEILRFAIE